MKGYLRSLILVNLIRIYYNIFVKINEILYEKMGKNKLIINIVLGKFNFVHNLKE